MSKFFRDNLGPREFEPPAGVLSLLGPISQDAAHGAAHANPYFIGTSEMAHRHPSELVRLFAGVARCRSYAAHMLLMGARQSLIYIEG
jgi:hypothetical protein